LPSKLCIHVAEIWELGEAANTFHLHFPLPITQIASAACVECIFDSMLTQLRLEKFYTSFEVADFRLLWNDAENRYTIIGFVKNALDEIGYGSSTGSSPTPVGSRRTVSLTYPRTYGMELQYRF